MGRLNVVIQEIPQDTGVCLGAIIEGSQYHIITMTPPRGKLPTNSFIVTEGADWQKYKDPLLYAQCINALREYLGQNISFVIYPSRVILDDLASMR